MKAKAYDFFEEDIMENDLADALERENATILEIELEKEIRQTTPELPESSARKKLKRGFY